MSRTPAHRRRRALRLVICLSVSLLLHVSLVLAFMLSSDALWRPALQITWLDLDNRLGAPRPGAKGPPSPAKTPESPPAKPRPPPPRRVATAAEHSPVALRRAVDGGGPRSDATTGAGSGSLQADKITLSDLAPGDAALILLLRMDRIRSSPYSASVRRLLEVFYDHKTILWGSGLDPVDDFEVLVIATPNPYRVTETFLAARSLRPQNELRQALERAASFGSRRLRWRAEGNGALRGDIPSPPKLPHDPRVIWLRGDVVLLMDPRQVAALSTAGPASDAGVPGPSWLARLGQSSDRGGAGSPGPGLLLQAVNLPRLLALPAGFPPPQNVQVAVEAQDPARAEAVLSFANEAAAAGFLAESRKRIERLRQSDDRVSRLLRWLGIADLLASIHFSRKGAVLTAALRLGEKDVKALLEMARAAVPQVRVPGMPDRRPTDAGSPGSDARPGRRGDADARAGQRDAGSVAP